MHIEQLKYIVEVAKVNSMSLASDNLYLTQPALSQSIKNLEKELGIQIFTRSRQGVTPTVQGNKLIQKANEILLKLGEFHNQVQDFNSSTQEKIKISSAPDLLPLAMKAILQFKNSYPDIQIEISEKTGPEVMMDIQQEAVDFGLANEKSLEGYGGKLEFEPLIEGKGQALVNKHSYLANYDTFRVNDLQNERFVIFNGPIYKQIFSSLFTQRVEILFASTNFQTLTNTVASGHAITLAPDFQIKHDLNVLNGDIIAIDLLDPHVKSLKAGWVTSKKLSQSSILFLEQLNKTISSLKKPEAVMT
ncbi:LysR family transcriptional regulator [Bacillus sp. 165]|uniref:LysR family transcriptional regulator n=1 Tax=Bacillus sp. 165 TaxID=1529117 RepID=UPI001ADB9C2C|nr:LysR family transcriptional regulator [Bacillus sp. 165]MBO9129209.1 LysR family transcriptional regulator [Bacillus sp. 165]